MSEEEEFELIPVSPLRRLEKRLEKMEKGDGSSVGNPSKFFSELVEIVRMNQEIVDEMAKANDALRIEVSKLPPKLEEVVSNLNELISYIKAAGVAGGPDMSGATGGAAPAADLSPLLKKMDELIEGNKKIVETNDMMINNLEQVSNRMKRPPGPMMMPGGQRLPMMRKPPQF
jgi:hypothetical protein